MKLILEGSNLMHMLVVILKDFPQQKVFIVWVGHNIMTPVFLALVLIQPLSK